jgi:hypothetical protein
MDVKLEKQAIEAMRMASELILAAAKEGERMGVAGVPSGYLYAAMMAHGMTLRTYEMILEGMVRGGLVRLANDMVCPGSGPETYQ